MTDSTLGQTSIDFETGAVRIDADTSRASKSFLDRLRCARPPKAAFLYGSRARGDGGAESDVDIAVIFEGTGGDRYRVLREMSDVAYDILIETGLHIQPLPLWESELERPELFTNPALIETIKREGLRL